MTEIELLLLHHFRAEPVPGKNAERVLHWLDERRHLLWSETKAAASQSVAAAKCSEGALIDALWFLPGANELEAAVVDGLPGVGGWQPLWSRDAEHGHKQGTPGLAVSRSGQREEQKQENVLPSRCAARL